MKVRRALISVSDKEGIVELAKGLESLGIEILSTSGTERLLKENGIGNVKSISAYTGQKEILGGRKKTLHPLIFGGILANRDEPEHMDDLKNAGAEPIDLVVVNLYPFESIVNKTDVRTGEAVEEIDIGGVTLLRAAAKNFKDVAVLVNPSHYGPVLEELKNNDRSLGEERLRELAVEAFAHTSAYDTTIHNFFDSKYSSDPLPKSLRLSFNRFQELRYGENPYQKAAFYNAPLYTAPCVHNSIQLYGKPLSFNNIVDIDAAMGIVMDFDRPTATIIKHTVPCGLASADKLSDAYRFAHKSDPISAYGSIAGFNKEVDLDTAETMRKHFIECVIAPDYAPEALELLKKKKKLRILKPKSFEGDVQSDLHYMGVRGGILVQTHDIPDLNLDDLKVATKRAPTDEELKAMAFAWKAIRYIKSNGIVLARDKRTVGIGGGQTSRVDAVMIAVRKAGEEAKGSVMSS
ncbi:MAG: bifunctional phosphoribosylaminoimidazolecarboxamide formyltransferase/IMP cyclohydrolase, partial [Thermoplasmata archaeon]|nr:bifunctional phosphoribosylaminoimidazolecarboxamide formyltransferase/IMP cyclohydrolase [Thermoplasmata archaeon]